LGEEEPIAEEELPAEEWVDERIGETRVSEKDVEAQLVTERCSPNKYGPTMKRARAHDADPTGSRPHDPKARSYAYSYGNTWALHSAHLRFKAWRESRSRQENRYGRHAVRIHL